MLFGQLLPLSWGSGGCSSALACPMVQPDVLRLLQDKKKGCQGM